MGFRATSAEDVYRYALRLDDKDRFLTDRFGLSIVFVNDDLQACRNFLTAHFVDLCHRTAHRIRFIFFANMSAQEMPVEPAGTLGKVLDFLRRHKIASAYSRGNEDDFWDKPRPPSLQSVPQPEVFLHKLGEERRRLSAVPGEREALEFAQRLGIGQHVPCFVLFTDVGAKQLAILPVHNMTVEEMYIRVRQWVDRYYTENRLILTRWDSIEKEISDIGSSINTAFSSIYSWCTRGKQAWRELTLICQALEIAVAWSLDSHTAWQQLYDSLIKLQSDPASLGHCFFLRRCFDACKESFVQLYLRDEQQNRRPRMVDRWQQVQGADEMWNELCRVEQSNTEPEGSKYSATLNEAVDELRACRDRLRAPEFAFSKWIAAVIKQRPSRHVYKQARNIFSSAPHERVVNLKEEYQDILRSLYGLPLSCKPEDGAAGTLDLLAQRFGVEPTSPQWKIDTANFRSYLVHFLQKQRQEVPGWLLKRLPDLALSEIISPEANSMETLSDEHPVQVVLRAEQIRYQQEISQLKQQYEETAIRCATNLIAALQAEMSQHPAVSMQERELVRGQLVAKLTLERDRLEKEVLAQNPDILSQGPFVTAERLLELHRALDEYETVVQQFNYPHLDDPKVLMLEIDKPIADSIQRGPYVSI